MFGHCFNHMTPLPRIVYILNLYEMHFYCILSATLLISSYVYLIIALCFKEYKGAVSLIYLMPLVCAL